MAGNSWQSPTTSEPSMGTAHPCSDATKSTTLVVNVAATTYAAGAWSTACTMTGVPVGAKAAWAYCYVYRNTLAPTLCIEAASGYTLSDVSVAANCYKYWSLMPELGTNQGNRIMRIHLDSNRQFKFAVDTTSSTVKIGSAIDYEM